MTVSPPMPDCHTSVSYFQGFQMSAIPHVFGLLCLWCKYGSMEVFDFQMIIQYMYQVRSRWDCSCAYFLTDLLSMCSWRGIGRWLDSSGLYQPKALGQDLLVNRALELQQGGLGIKHHFKILLDRREVLGAARAEPLDTNQEEHRDSEEKQSLWGTFSLVEAQGFLP